MTGRYDEMMRHLVDAENALDRARYHAVALGKELAAPPPTPDRFEKGAIYPSAAKVNLLPAFVRPGATMAHVEVMLDRETPNTAIAFIRCLNGSGRVERDFVQPVFFRPGGPLKQTISFAIRPMTEGQTVGVVQAQEPDGASRGIAQVVVMCSASATPTAGLPAAPKPPAFVPLGDLAFNVRGADLAVTDEGTEASFSTALPHGRTQSANGETGYYGELGRGHIRADGDLLVLETKASPEPIEARSGGLTTSYRLLSAILSGHTYQDTWFKHGTIEWDVRMPNSPGSWPGLWLMSLKQGADGKTYPQWPFEIDVYEGFNYNPSRVPLRSLSANLHGGPEGSGVRKWVRPAANMSMQDFGLLPTLDSEFHTFACTIDANWIAIFVDEIETLRYASPFDSTLGWYPLTQLATKADPAKPVTGKNTMEVRSLKVWRAN
jgi:hypothetical protein